MSRHLGIGAVLTITLAMALPTEALAQDPPQPTAPTPAPSPRIIIPDDPNALPFPVGNTGSKAEPNWEIRFPNHTYFKREFEHRQLRAAMGDAQNAVPLWIYSQIAAACLHRNAGEDTASLIGGKEVGDERFELLVRGLERTYRQCMSPEVAILPRELINAALMELLMLEETERMRLGVGEGSLQEAQSFIVGDGSTDLYAVGRCVAILAPDPALALLASEPDSDDEMKKLNVAYAAAPSCGLSEVPEDLEPLMQRAAIAGGLYYWGAKRYGIVTVGEE